MTGLNVIEVNIHGRSDYGWAEDEEVEENKDCGVY